jgi:fatty-acyl-CoA synthase
MAAPRTLPQGAEDRAAAEARVVEIIRALLEELGNSRLAEAVTPSAHLDRDLGLGSLERVELMLRLDQAFGLRLPEGAFQQADTVADLVAAVSGTEAAQTPEAAAEFAAPAAAPVRDELPASARLAARAETLVEILRERGRADAGRPHIHLRGDDGEAHTITYGELLEAASTAAAHLARRSIGPGAPVAVMLPTCREFFYTFFGILLAGGIPVPIYPPVRADRLEEYAARQAAILDNAEARLLVIPPRRDARAVASLLKPRVKSLAGVVDAAKLLEPSAAHAPHTHARGDDIAFLQYTSGSTGEPKGVILTHANLLANIRAFGEAFDLRAADVGVSWLPLYHDMGLIGCWFGPLAYGFPIVILSPLAFLSRPERWLWAIHHHRGTLSPAPNFAYELCARKIADRDIEGLDLSSWRAALNGAEPVNPATMERFAERFARYGLRRSALVPVYGLAEATLAVTIPDLAAHTGPQVDRVRRDVFELSGRAEPAAADDPTALEFVACGRPIRGFELRIADRRGRALPERTEGRLWFRGPSATRGYYRNPAATRALLHQDPDDPVALPWVDSGDRAYLVGGQLYLTGRTKDIIIKAGRNLYPHEIEEVAGSVPGVRKGCVVAFGVSDTKTATERLVVVAETRQASEEVAHAIRERVTELVGLPPDALELVAPHSIPKTSSGKLRRDQTRRLYLAGRLGAAHRPVWWQVARLAIRGAAETGWQWLRRGLEILYGVYALIAFGLFIVPTWLLMLAAPSRALAARITKSGTSLLMWLIGAPVRLEGRENLPAPGQPCVYVANHTSYMDIIVLLATMPYPYRFVAKIEVTSMPFIRSFMRRLGHLAFDRADRSARLRQVEEMEESLRNGVPVLVFPEGTFTPLPGVRAFQLGAFKVAATVGCPVVPVALRGTRELLRDETVLPRPSRITVTVLPAMDVTPASRRPRAQARPEWQEIVRLRDAARRAIAAHSGEHLL